jgi:hypothetical protein
MEKTHQGHSPARGHNTRVNLAGGIKWGLIGGLAGTLVMDLLLMGTLSTIGLPAFTCFSIIGDTIAHLLSISGGETANVIPLGVTAHYLIGPAVGAIFGAALARIAAHRVDMPKKSIILAILYVEILSQPILAATPIVLKMTASSTLQWFGISFVMHLVYGAILGAIVRYGSRLAPQA